MPIVVQSSEITDRLRRFLGLRGRVNMGLDETMIAAVLEADLSDTPYRKEGLSGDTFISRGATAAQFSYMFWGPKLKACTLIVDQLTFINSNATAQLLQIGYSDTDGGVTMPITAFSGEMRTIPTDPLVGKCAWGMDSAANALELITLEIVRVQMAALETRTLIGPWTIQPTQNMVAKFSLVNTSIILGVKARQFQLVER